MRAVLAFALCSLLAGIAYATGPPIAYVPGSGEHNYLAGGRDVCWSEPADLGDMKISSEIIGAYGLESEIANDFMVSGYATIGPSVAWGGLYNWAGEPNLTSFNLKFYDDAGCVPGTVFDSYWGVTPTQTFVGYDGYGYPTYNLEYATYTGVAGDTLYWFGIQAADHVYPPQWGRQGTGGIVTNCESVFRSAYFGYPDWTPVSQVVGSYYDAAQEFSCYGIPPIATRTTSWGAVKGLFR